MKPIETARLAQILGTIWGIIFVFSYLILTRHVGLPVIKVLHVCLIFPAVLCTAAMPELYDWVDKWVYIIYFNVHHFMMLYVTMVLLNIGYTHYVPVLSEFLGLILILAYGLIGGVITTVPFKFVQLFYFNVDMYGAKFESKGTSDNSDKSTLEKFRLTLATKNETELTVILKDVLAKEKYEQATLVREELKRFR